MRLILVTGQMRSGTSLAAEMLHFLGAPAGIMQLMPMHPTWKNEWEDAELTHKLVELFPLEDPKPNAARKEEFRDFFPQYLANRARYIQTMDRVWNQRTGTFSMKSPLLALVLDDVREACDEFKIELKTVVCKRNADAVLGSLERALPEDKKAGAKKLNRLLATHIAALKPDLEVVYEDVLANPRLWAQKLQTLVGGRPFSDRAAMAAGKVNTCPQHG